MSVLRTCKAGEGDAGTHLMCWVHIRPVWEAKAELHAMSAPEQQVEHSRGQNTHTPPGSPSPAHGKQSALTLGLWPMASQVVLWMLFAVGAGKSGPLPKAGVLGSGSGTRGTYGQSMIFKLLQLSGKGTLRRVSSQSLSGALPMAEYHPRSM